MKAIFEHNRMDQMRDWRMDTLILCEKNCREEMFKRIRSGDELGAAVHARILFRSLREQSRRYELLWYGSKPIIELQAEAAA